MSFRISERCVALQMPGVAKSVLMALADMSNDDGYCWPSLDKLTLRTCWKRRAVINAIAWLEEQGAISAERRHRTSTTYLIHPEKFSAQGSEVGLSEEELAIPVDNLGAPDAPKESRVHVVHSLGARGASLGCTTCTPIIRNHQGTINTHSATQTPRVCAGETGIDKLIERICLEMHEEGLSDSRPLRTSTAVRRYIEEHCVQPEQFIEAASIAAKKKMDFSYAIGVLERKLKRAAAASKDVLQGCALPWDTNLATVNAKAKDLDMEPWSPNANSKGEFESFPAFTARVRTRLQEQESPA
jgi:hypothetical protein